MSKSGSVVLNHSRDDLVADGFGSLQRRQNRPVDFLEIQVTQWLNGGAMFDSLVYVVIIDLQQNS